MSFHEQKIRWGILGASNIARTRIAPAIQSSANGRLVAVASRNMESAKEFARQFGIEAVFDDYQSLIRSPLVDAIYISVPTGLHYAWSSKAGEAAKPTLCEKPLCSNASQAAALIGKFEAHKTLLAEAGMYKFHPLTRRVKELVNKGRIGPIKHIHAAFTVKRPDENDIRMQPDLGGGALLDLGYYCIGIAQHLVQEMPETVEGRSQWLLENDVDLVSTGVLQYPSGTTCTFLCGFLPTFEISYQVTGEWGRITVPYGGMVLWPGSDFKIIIEDGAGVHEEIIPQTDHYKLMVEDFARAVSASGTTQFSLTESLDVLTILDQLRASPST